MRFFRFFGIPLKFPSGFLPGVSLEIPKEIPSEISSRAHARIPLESTRKNLPETVSCIS